MNILVRRYPMPAAVLVFCFVVMTLRGAAQEKEFPSYERMLEALKGLQADDKNVATVSNFFFQRESASFNLEEGTIALCKPIGGKVRAAIFRGKGTLSYTPATKVEREQLERIHGSQRFEDEIRWMTIFFADSTEQELRSGCVFSQQTSLPMTTASIIKEGLTAVIPDETDMVDLDLAKTLLENRTNGLFYAIINTKKNGGMSWSYSPYAEEQIQFSKERVISGLTKNVYEPINQYSAESGPPEENFTTGDFLIERYTMNCTIDKELEFTSVMNVTGTVTAAKTSWLLFEISDFMTVTGVRMNGADLPYYAGTDRTGSMWVQLPKEYNRGDSLLFQFTCASKSLMKRYENWTFLRSSIGWYPSCGYKQLSYFDATFHVPKRYTFVAVGDKVSTAEKDEIITTQWATSQKIRNYSFTIGVFTSKKIEDKDLPNFMIHSLTTDQRDNVMIDIAQSFKFYQKLYGELGLKHFDVAEIPFAHGEAFPGLLHLSYITFESTSRTGFNESFCGHEVAHQWWGIGVDFKSYHDQWLSEAFADYSSMLYTQVALKDNMKFFTMMNTYRVKIVDKRKSLFGSGTKSGPICLGYRTQGSLTPDDYDLIIYKKGLWVLHMLRNMFLDVKTMKEDAFFKIMRSFFQTYKGKRATTEDFRRTVEEFVGQDVGWFFDQWVYGTDIPRYTFSYKVTEEPDGKFKVTCKVKQDNVPPEFKMSVPIRVGFGDDQFARMRVFITGQESVFDLPLMPKRPKNILFNDLESVLCEVEDVDWKD